MFRNRMVAILILILTVITPAVSAHPGHPTFNPHHVHGPHDLNPVAVLLLAALAIAVLFAGRDIVRRCLKWLRNEK